MGVLISIRWTRVCISLVAAGTLSLPIEASEAPSPDASSITCEPGNKANDGKLVPCGSLTDTSYAGADLTASRLDGLRVLRTNLSHTDFGGSSLVSATLRESNAMDAHFEAIRADGMKLIGGRFTRTSFVGARMRDCDVRGALMGFTNFSDADLRGCVFRRVFLVGSKWQGANLEGARFVDCIGSPSLSQAKNP